MSQDGAAASPKGTVMSRFTGAFALLIGLVFWGLLALGSNWVVHKVLNVPSGLRWMQWQGTIVLVVTLVAAWWAALRVVNKPEDFLEGPAKEEPKAAK